MSSNGIIEHRKDYFYLELREEYLIICKNCKYKKPVKEGAKCKASHHCKALILAILERWTDSKRKKGEDLAIYMSYPMWVDEMHGLFGRNVIIDSLDELVGEGLISREKHRMYGKDTYKYYLNCQELNHRIKLLPPGDAFTSKRDETTEPFTNQSDAFTSKPQMTDTRLQVNEDAFKSKRNIESNINSININSTEKEKPATQTTTPSQPDTLSPSPSQNKSIEEWLSHFDQLYRKKSGVANYRYSRKDTKIREAIAKLIETGATFEQVEFVFNDIWDDKTVDRNGTMFWQEHKGKIWVVESQFATRVAKMLQPAAKRRTASGFANWTEDKSMGVPAIVEPVVSTPKPEPVLEPTKPKEPALPVGYTRLKTEKPRGPRSLQARLQAQKSEH